MIKTARIGLLALSTLLLGCAHNQSANQIDPSKIQNAKTPAISSSTHFAAGQMAEVQGRSDVAIDQYKQAVKIDPKNDKALYSLGCLYANLKQFSNAEQTWQDYIQVSPDQATGYSNLAYTYELSGDTASASDAYQKGIAADTKNVPCRTNYGILLARQNRVQEAIRTWQPVLSDVEIHYNLASVYEESGRKLEAKAEFEKAVQLDPKFDDAKQRLASMPLDK